MKKAIVLGGSRGIGKAIALSLGEAGCEVVVNYSNSPNKADEVVSEIISEGGKAYSLKANVSNEEEVNELVSNVLNKSGKIDVLINNAGITRDGLLMRMKTEDWQSVINLNLSGVFLCTRAVSRSMIKQKSGRIINITSVVGHTGNIGQANYTASKAGIVAMSKSLAIEYAKKNINVNCISPGFISTAMTDQIDKNLRKLS